MKQIVVLLLGFVTTVLFAETLDDYKRFAISQNPAVKAAYAGYQAELEKIGSVRGLPDPQVTFGYFLENIETAVGPQEWKVGFKQKIPWPGKLKVQGDIQSIKAEAAQTKLLAVLSDLIYQVQTVYLDAYFLEKSISITRENLGLVNQWEKVILTRYRSALAKHPDLIKTQIEAIKLEDDLTTLAAERRPIIERFRTLLNTDTLSLIDLPKFLDNPEHKLNREKIRSAIFDHNPELASINYKQKAADKAVDRAKMNWLPDFSLGVDYMSTGDKWMGGRPVPESGKDPLIVMGSLSLPLWGYKQTGQVRSARKIEEQAQALVENKTNGLEAAFENAWFAYEDAERKWFLYEHRLLPKSLESLKATEKAYIGGEMEFLSLVDAQRRHLNFTLAAENAKVSFYKSIAQLLKLAGRTE